MIDIRSKRQREFADVFLHREKLNLFGFDGGGILYLCPRFGKCRVGIHVIKDEFHEEEILIAYPDNKIKKSWEDEFKIMDYYPNVTYTTHKSLHKYTDNQWGLVILDECHLLSEAQLNAAKKIKGTILGLTGTMTTWTEKDLKRELNLKVLAEYPIEQAIEEGVLTDYEIRIVKVPLDNRLPQQFGSKFKTEKRQFDSISWVIDKIERENEDEPNPLKKKDTKFLRLARMRVIKDSIAKLKKTQNLLQSFVDERVLVFCGAAKIADQIGCPVYHAKKGEKEVFEMFAEGIGKHLVVIKIGNTGVTYKPLQKTIINYFDSNAENLSQKILRCMAMEYDNLEKKSIIYIVSTDEPVEEKWLARALEFFDETKIKYYD